MVIDFGFFEGRWHTDRKNHLGERNDAFERKLFVAFETNDYSLTVKEYSLTVNTRRQIT